MSPRWVKTDETCGVCGTTLIRDASPQQCWADGFNKRPFCPNRDTGWHEVLDEKMGLLSQPHPASYREELKREIEILKKIFL